jgi:hypothetical protein
LQEKQNAQLDNIRKARLQLRAYVQEIISEDSEQLLNDAPDRPKLLHKPLCAVFHAAAEYYAHRAFDFESDNDILQLQKVCTYVCAWLYLSNNVIA